MTGTPENPTQLPPIVIDSSNFVDLPDGSYLSDGHSPDFEGVYLSAARRAMQRIDPDRHLDAIIKNTTKGMF